MFRLTVTTVLYEGWQLLCEPCCTLMVSSYSLTSLRDKAGVIPPYRWEQGGPEKGRDCPGSRGQLAAGWAWNPSNSDFNPTRLCAVTPFKVKMLYYFYISPFYLEIKQDPINRSSLWKAGLVDGSGWYRADISDFTPFRYSCIFQINYFMWKRGKDTGNKVRTCLILPQFALWSWTGHFLFLRLDFYFHL